MGCGVGSAISDQAHLCILTTTTTTTTTTTFSLTTHTLILLFYSVYLQYAAFILLLVWNCRGQAKLAMYLGLVSCICCVAADFFVPSPLPRYIVIFNGTIKMPVCDPIPIIFGFLFGLASFLLLLSKEEQQEDDEKPITITSKEQQQQQQQQQPVIVSDTCKKQQQQQQQQWSIIYINLMALCHVNTLMKPAVFYNSYGTTTTLSSAYYRTTPLPVQMIMNRVAFCIAMLQLLMSFAICAQIFGTNTNHRRGTTSATSSLLYFPLVYELTHILYVQLFYPHNPHAYVFIPTLYGHVLVMPPFTTSLVIIVGSLVALQSQQQQQQTDVLLFDDNGDGEAASQEDDNDERDNMQQTVLLDDEQQDDDNEEKEETDSETEELASKN